MSTSAAERRTALQRIPFRAPIRLLSPDHTRSIWVHSHNLSRSGIQVSSSEVFEIGTVLGLDIPVPGPRSSLACRGRVVWVERERSCGMGIQFMDLTAEERQALSELVSVGDDVHLARPVKVWFEGQPLPLPAHAIPTPEGMVLSLQMPHLRKHSQVFYRFSDEGNGGDSGVLQGVTLQPGAVPLLVATIRQEAGEEVTMTAWPPLPDHGQEPLRLVPWGLDEEIPVVIEAARTQNLGEIGVTEDTVVNLDTPIDSDPEVIDEQEAREAAVVLPLEASEVEPSAERHRLEELLLDAPARPGAEDSHWSLEPLSDSDLSREMQRAQRRERGRSQLLLWLAASVMTGLALASVVHTGLLSQLTRSVSSWFSVPQPPLMAAPRVTAPAAPSRTEALPPAAPAPATSPQPVHAALPVAAPAAARAVDEPRHKAPVSATAPQGATGAAATPTAPVGAAAGITAAQTHQPLVVRRGDTLELTIPVKGVTEGARYYMLEDPDALAINLPRATATGRMGSFPVREVQGVRLLWVRERLGGLHLRLFFKGDVPEPAVQLLPDAVKVQLTF